MLSLYQLSIFLAVAGERSFSAAARKRHLTQPAVSQQVKALEQSLGVALFQRNGQRIDLTLAGSQLLPMATDLLRLADHVEETMDGLREGDGGRLMIGHGAACLQSLLPRLVRHFRRMAAEVQVSILASDNRTVLARLLSHELDFGFVDLRRTGDGIEYTPLFRDRIVALVPARHAWTRRETIPLDEVCAAPLIVPSEDSGLREMLAAACSRNGILWSEVNESLVIGGLDGLGPAVEAGMGVALAPRATMRQMPPKLRGVPVEADGLEHVVYWARLPNRLPNRAFHRFYEFMMSAETIEFLQREVAAS